MLKPFIFASTVSRIQRGSNDGVARTACATSDFRGCLVSATFGDPRHLSISQSYSQLVLNAFGLTRVRTEPLCGRRGLCEPCELAQLAYFVIHRTEIFDSSTGTITSTESVETCCNRRCLSIEYLAPSWEESPVCSVSICLTKRSQL